MPGAITNSQLQSSRRERYVIHIRGQLDSRWSDWFDGWTVMPLDGIEEGETELSGAVADQAALHGLLARIRDLNLKLISLSRIDPREGNGRRDGQ